jgi:hypothetical protein
MAKTPFSLGSPGERLEPIAGYERRHGGGFYTVVAMREESGKYIGLEMLPPTHPAYRLTTDTLNDETDKIAQRDESDVLPLERAENSAVTNIRGLKKLPKHYFWMYTSEYDNVDDADSALDDLKYRLDVAAHDPALAAFVGAEPTPAKPAKPAITAKKLVAAPPKGPMPANVQVHFDGTGWLVSAGQLIRPFRFAGRIAADKYAAEVADQFHIKVVTD